MQKRPHSMHASAVENLLPFLKPGSRVLGASHFPCLTRMRPYCEKRTDVGCGSGYLLGIFHNLVAPTGHVTGIEHIVRFPPFCSPARCPTKAKRELSDLSERNLRADGHGPALDSKNVTVVTGDGRQGYAQGAPYDAIHVGAAAPVMPKALIEQLARPGRMCAFLAECFDMRSISVSANAQSSQSGRTNR